MSGLPVRFVLFMYNFINWTAPRGGQLSNTCSVADTVTDDDAMSRVRPIKVKCKVHPSTGHEGPEAEKGHNFTLSLTSALNGCEWSKIGSLTP